MNKNNYEVEKKKLESMIKEKRVSSNRSIPYPPVDTGYNIPIPIYSTTDLALGGLGGAANAPIIALADNTQYLYDKLTSSNNQLGVNNVINLATLGITDLDNINITSLYCFTLPSTILNIPLTMGIADSDIAYIETKFIDANHIQQTLYSGSYQDTVEGVSTNVVYIRTKSFSITDPTLSEWSEWSQSANVDFVRDLYVLLQSNIDNLFPIGNDKLLPGTAVANIGYTPNINTNLGIIQYSNAGTNYKAYLDSLSEADRKNPRIFNAAVAIYKVLQDLGISGTTGSMFSLSTHTVSGNPPDSFYTISAEFGLDPFYIKAWAVNDFYKNGGLPNNYSRPYFYFATEGNPVSYSPLNAVEQLGYTPTQSLSFQLSYSVISGLWVITNALINNTNVNRSVSINTQSIADVQVQLINFPTNSNFVIMATQQPGAFADSYVSLMTYKLSGDRINFTNLNKQLVPTSTPQVVEQNPGIVSVMITFKA